MVDLASLVSDLAVSCFIRRSVLAIVNAEPVQSWFQLLEGCLATFDHD